MNQPIPLERLLERAISIAEQQHAGQTDKAGRPYIEHPKRVMQAMENDAERIVAILHDVIEDTDLTLDQLAAEGFPGHLLEALDSVTRRDGETYEAFIARAAANAIGRRVKYADLRDNADLSRIAAPTAADVAGRKNIVARWPSWMPHKYGNLAWTR
ncbi:GTP pyrophosphokinase [Cystobacter fuscus]|uniref:GTP pyrophosphokinase n=1 Tax=Cystobacter fuscus TaxID=43 RepID=UPI0037C173FE